MHKKQGFSRALVGIATFVVILKIRADNVPVVATPRHGPRLRLKPS